MAVRSKTGTGRVEHRPGPPKKTRQGQGQHSRAQGNSEETQGTRALIPHPRLGR
jgi:hypothetical protein